MDSWGIQNRLVTLIIVTVVVMSLHTVGQHLLKFITTTPITDLPCKDSVCLPIHKSHNVDPDFKEKSDLLVEVRGISKKTAAKLKLGTCDRKQIAALIGVAPYNRDSGHKSGQRFISGGRPDVRSILYMATLTATRCNPVIREMYQRLLKAGKIKKVAIVACMRKLPTILNAIIRNRSQWNLALSA